MSKFHGEKAILMISNFENKYHYKEATHHGKDTIW